MTKLLVVKGHPLTAEDSFSIKGLDTFVSAYKTANADDEVEVLDVFSADIPEIDQDMASAFIAMQNGVDFTALSESQQDKVARFGAFTEQFLSADKVVIASPLWNLMIPASLKKWIDTVNVAGKTFRYTAEGPKGLATDKKVMHLQASGGMYNGQDTGSQYMKTIFEFIGTDFYSLSVEGHAYQPEKAEEFLAEFLGKVETAAQEF